MSDLVNLTYQPGEADSPNTATPKTPASIISGTSVSVNTPETPRSPSDDSFESEDSTESEESEEETSTEEESPLVIKRSPNPVGKLYPEMPGTPGLTDGSYVDAKDSLEGTSGLSVDAASITNENTKAGSKTAKALAESNTKEKQAKSEDTSNNAPNTQDNRTSTSGQNPRKPDENKDQNTKDIPEPTAEERTGCKLKFFNRIFEFPIVQSALYVYDSAKDIPCIGMAINLTEIGANLAMSPVVFFGAPFANLCSAPINGADAMMCFGLDVAEVFFPCLKMTPSQMIGASQKCAVNCVCCFPRAVSGVCGLCGASNLRAKKE